MAAVVGVLAIGLIAVIVWDAFEALVLPRRVTRRLRPTRFFYRATWRLWTGVAAFVRVGGRRETYLSFFGPLSLLFLIAMWAVNLIVGFAALQWALGNRLDVPEGTPTFGASLYVSGTTFFTLGLGDVRPVGGLARLVTVVEAGMGFGFLAVVISYLPVLYGGFSRREVAISLLDARAGSPPTAAQLLARHASDPDGLCELLHEWEQWSAELLETHLSYPVLAYFRSQHENQSWLAALTAVLDASALATVALAGAPARQARLTFAIARHAVVDLTQVFRLRPRSRDGDRMMAKRILVPLDDTEAHEAIVPVVRAVARESGGSVRLLRVSPVPEQVLAPSGQPITYLDQEMDRLTAIGMEDLRRVEGELDGVPVESVVRFGEVVEEIVSEAEATHADLIALSASARGRLRGALAPGVAARVAAKSSVPTLVLRR